MRNKTKLVGSWGINDAGYAVTKSLPGGKIYTCPFYGVWKSMIQRCYSTTTMQRCPTYEGCSIVEAWKHFSAFRAWMVLQDWEGNELDKDILLKGNKVYCPEYCVFVPKKVNLFIKPNTTGITYVSKRPRLVMRNPIIGKTEYLGTFATVEEALLVRNKRKHALALELADEVKDSRVADALRTYYLEDLINE